MSHDLTEPTDNDNDLAAMVRSVKALTPARVLAGRVGSSYRTETHLALREDHAEAVDAVHAELDLYRDLGTEFVERWGLIELQSCARSKAEYLLRPDLGRRLDRASVVKLQSGSALAPVTLTSTDRELSPLLKGGRVPSNSSEAIDIQVVIGDGLSATAVVAQVPALLPLLSEGSARLNLRFGRTFFIRNCRVGVLNDVGRLVDAAVIVLLIGERPGLATAESLSAYLAYRPRPGHTDAHRNLISNIHARGTSPADASERILRLAMQMIRLKESGVAVKEQLVQVL
jgi:ethanolamine ammonia-lyase small subunit